MEAQVADTGEYGDAAGPMDSAMNEVQAEARQEEHVPLSALQAERQNRQALEEKMRLLEDHVALMQANQQQYAARPQQDEMDGLSDDDVLTVGEAKKFMQNLQQNYQMGIEELRISQKYPDYQKVIKDYLPKVIEKNPALKSTLQNDPNKYELAYYLATQSDEYRAATQQVKKSAEAERIVQNAQRAGSLSAMGHGSSASQPSGFKQMSDDEFMKLANKNRGAY